MKTDLIKLTVPHGGQNYDLWQADGGEPLARDLDLAVWLGYERPDRIKWLIEKHAPSLGAVFTVSVKTSAKGGRPGRSYYLTEAQALFLAAKSETPKATEVLKAMIEVFILAKRGEMHGVEQGLHEQVLGQLEEEREHRVRMEIQIADLRAAMRGGLAMPCGRDEKRSLTALAAAVAKKVLSVELKAPVGDDARQSPTFKQKMGDELEAAAKAAGVVGRDWSLLTVQESAVIRCHLMQREKKMDKRLSIKRIPGRKGKGAQLKLVV